MLYFYCIYLNNKVWKNCDQESWIVGSLFIHVTYISVINKWYFACIHKYRLVIQLLCMILPDLMYTILNNKTSFMILSFMFIGPVWILHNHILTQWVSVLYKLYNIFINTNNNNQFSKSKIYNIDHAGLCNYHLISISIVDPLIMYFYNGYW